MNKKLLLYFLSCFFLWNCQPKKELPIVQDLHANWSFKRKSSNDWNAATVPGNVFTDLLNNKLIEDPFVGNNEEKVQWVSETDWEYRSEFSVEQKILDRKHIELTFEGLDTYAKVFLNDQLILTTNNAFRTYSVPVKEALKLENELRIEFEAFGIQESIEKEKLDYELPEGNRVFTRKAQFQYGWDWGPKLNTSGIWKDVYLKAWDAVVLKDVFVSQGMITETDASLEAELTLSSDTSLEAEIIAEVDGKKFQQTVQLEQGVYDYSLPISIEKPQLWWPHNLGEPHLYDINIKVIANNTVLAEKSIKHGIRTIELIAEKDSIGQSFYFTVNDVPVFMKGANYIPQNSFQNQVTEEHYQRLLNDVVDTNMNMLRVWGGGIYENDIFYNLCDEKGILVWQDFMFACAMYPGDQQFLENVQQEAIDQVVRLRNHASIALWCGNNENSEGWHRWGWQTGKTEEQKEEIWDNYQKVFDSILPYTVDRLTTTSYWGSSPKYGRGNPKYKFEGDAHDWWVWHDEYPFEHFETNVPRFMSEYGFQSFPSFEAINYVNQNESVDIFSDGMKSHQKHSRGFRLIDDYMKRDYPIVKDDKEYVYLSQLTQAKGITMGIEAHRRARPYNMGTLYWQLNDCWPVISWSSIDYFGNWKALQYKAKKSFADLLISFEMNDQKVSTYIVNDHLQTINDTLSVKVIDFSGKELWSTQKFVTAKANASSKVYEFSLGELSINPEEVMLVTNFHDHSSNFYFVKPKDLQLPKEEINYQVSKSKSGFTIELSSEVLQKDVFLYTKAKGHFSDNFFDLNPNTKRTIFFETESTSIDDLQVISLNTINREETPEIVKNRGHNQKTE